MPHVQDRRHAFPNHWLVGVVVGGGSSAHVTLPVLGLGQKLAISLLLHHLVVGETPNPLHVVLEEGGVLLVDGDIRWQTPRRQLVVLGVKPNGT